MYAEYEMGEFRWDGTVNKYHFIADDPDGFILKYDNDDKVNYELNKGHYEPENSNELVRKSQYEYVVTNPDGAKITYYGYFAPWRSPQDPKAGKMIKLEDRFGNTTSFSYNEQGNIKEITDTADRKINFIWENNVITKLIDPSGNETSYSYDEFKRLVEVSTPEGRKMHYGYDDHNRLNSITNGEGYTYHFEYNSDDKVVEVKNNEDEVIYSFIYNGEHVSLTDVYNNRWDYIFDNKKVKEITNPLGQTVQFQYNEKGKITSKVSPSGTELYEYNSDGLLVKKTAIGLGYSI